MELYLAYLQLSFGASTLIALQGELGYNHPPNRER